MVAPGAGVVVDDDVDEVTVAIVGEPTGATIDVVAEASVVEGPTTTLLDDGVVVDTDVPAPTDGVCAKACNKARDARAANVVFLVLSTA
jgi:hypothetical protein